MYDVKYLEDGNVKKIATVEDAIAVIATEAFCDHMSCKDCPIRMYEVKKGHNCSDVKDEAENLLAAELCGGTKIDKETVIAVYNRIVEHAPEPKPEPVAETAPDEPASKTCLECLKARRHESGILFCESFGNFTHEDGYCYRFEPSDMIDETACG